MILPDQEGNPPPVAIRLAAAVVLGALGFVTGAIATWMLTDVPGVSIGSAAPFWVGCAVGLLCLAAGFLHADKTLDALGEIWRVVWELSVGILATLRALIR
jgi:hypothetical protein